MIFEKDKAVTIIMTKISILLESGIMKTIGVYTEVEDYEVKIVNKKSYFTNSYILPPILEYIPIKEMFTWHELMDLK